MAGPFAASASALRRRKKLADFDRLYCGEIDARKAHHLRTMTDADQQKNYRRREAAAYVREKHNLPCAAATLASLATRGGGPSYRLFGRVPIYRKEDLDAWVEARMGEPVRSTSEARGASGEPHRKTPIPSTAPSNGSRSAKPKTSPPSAADNVGGSADKAAASVTETGAATTNVPVNPRWRSAKGRASGGVVTG
jgi:hypothetical protein